MLDQPEEMLTLSARYYRQKAVEARRAAEAVTTRAVKARLHGLARISIGWQMPLTAQRDKTGASAGFIGGKQRG